MIMPVVLLSLGVTTVEVASKLLKYTAQIWKAKTTNSSFSFLLLILCILLLISIAIPIIHSLLSGWNLQA